MPPGGGAPLRAPHRAAARSERGASGGRRPGRPVGLPERAAQRAQPGLRHRPAGAREAKDGAGAGTSVIRVGDPLLDLIGTTVGGLLGGIDDSVRQHEIDDAAAELAATPRSLDRPTYRPYSFERVVVRAEKQAVVPVALLDAGGRELRATELRQSERRELFVLRGLDPRDRDYEQHRSSSMTEASLARWARTPPALRLSSVAVALIEDAPAVAPLAEIAPAAGPPRAGPASVGLEEPRDIRLDLPPPPDPAATTASADRWRRAPPMLRAPTRMPRAWSRSAPAGRQATASTSATTWS